MLCKNTIYVTLLCFMLFFEWSAEKKILLRMPASGVQIMSRNAEICSKEYGISPDTVHNIISWNVPNDDNFKEFMYCIDSKSGYADGDGHFVIEEFLAMKIVNGTREEVAAMFKDCNKITKEAPGQTLYAVSECVTKGIVWGT